MSAARELPRQTTCCICSSPKMWRVHNHHRRRCPPKDPLPVQRQFISCESTKISSEHIFPLLKRARHQGAHGDCGGCRWWLCCDQRRRRAHKSGRESLHSFWSKGKSRREQEERKGHFWKRPRRVERNERTNNGAEDGKGREGGRAHAMEKGRRRRRLRHLSGSIALLP